MPQFHRQFDPRSMKLVIFDLDGTLIDSAEYHWLTWREALSREGYDLTHKQFKSSFGQRNDEILRSYFGSELPANEIEQPRMNRHRDAKIKMRATFRRDSSAANLKTAAQS